MRLQIPTAAALTLAIIMLTIASLSSNQAQTATGSIIVQSTTSTANSGLYEHILPIFKANSGISVNIVAVGTGQAIKNARNCDGDVLLVHAKFAEQKFVASGYGVKRFNLMYNDFIIVGPPTDPANINGMNDAIAAFKKIATAKALFASRADNSGTHKKEMYLWRTAKLDPTTHSGKWYRETGSGMGATLNVAVGMRAYVMTDRATWLSFKNKRDFNILVEDDKKLFNQYGVTLVDAKKCPNTKTVLGQAFVKWLISKKGQRAISSYNLNGQQLFFPNAN